MGSVRTVALRSLALALVTLLGFLPQAGRAADPFTIDVILPQTGAAAFLGKEETQALQALQRITNQAGGIQGRQIEFSFQDDQSNPGTAVQLLNGVLAKKRSIVLGSSFVATCSAMAPLVAKSGPVEYCFSPGIHPDPGSYVFSASPSTTDLLKVAERYFHARGWTKVATLTSTDATGQDADRAIGGAFETPGSGETIVDREHFNPSDVSVTAQLEKVQSSGAQALIAWSTGTPFATVLRGANDIGLKLPMLTTAGNLTYAQMTQYAPFMSKQLYFNSFPFVTPNQIADPAIKRAVETYIDAFKPEGVRPDIGQSLAWDPALITLDALRHVGLNASATQIRDYIDSITGPNAIVGVYGRYDFKAEPQRGLTASGVTMARWVPDQKEWVAVSRPGGLPIAEAR